MTDDVGMQVWRALAGMLTEAQEKDVWQLVYECQQRRWVPERLGYTSLQERQMRYERDWFMKTRAGLSGVEREVVDALLPDWHLGLGELVEAAQRV